MKRFNFTLITLVSLLAMSLKATAQDLNRVSKTSTEMDNPSGIIRKKNGSNNVPDSAVKSDNLLRSQFPKLAPASIPKKEQLPKGMGGVAGGGGGKLEPLFKDIANNIASWIQSGNADLIESYLPKEISLLSYKTEMLRVLNNYNVTFTDDKVVVGNYEKTCRSFVDEHGTNQIICNITQFGLDTPENIGNIYRQVHHEFAGLACQTVNGELICLEQNKNEISDYRISNKITAFLGTETVFRLPIRPGLVFGETYVCSAEITGGSREKRKDIQCGDLVVTPDISEVVRYPESDEDTLYSKFSLYQPFSNCPHLSLASRYSTK